MRSSSRTCRRARAHRRARWTSCAAHLIGRLDNLDDVWVEWQLWFAELQETHTSLPFLNFFRSPEPDRSWITAAGAVLDAAAMVNSTIALPSQPMASLCIRSGFTALRSIARFFRMPHPEDPAPTTRSASRATSGKRRAASSRRSASRWWPIATRPGVTSRVGG